MVIMTPPILIPADDGQDWHPEPTNQPTEQLSLVQKVVPRRIPWLHHMGHVIGRNGAWQGAPLAIQILWGFWALLMIKKSQKIAMDSMVIIIPPATNGHGYHG